MRGSLGVIGIFCILLLCPFAGRGEEGLDEGFKVTGFGEWKWYASEGKQILSVPYAFFAYVKGYKWLIRVVPHDQVEDFFEGSGDGTNLYCVVGMEKSVERMQRRGATTGPNTVSAYTKHGSVPNMMTIHPVGPIWLAYASTYYFDGIGPSGIPIEPASAIGVASGQNLGPTYVPLTKKAVWERSITDLRFPLRVVYFEDGAPVLDRAGYFVKGPAYPKPFDQGFTNTLFEVISRTNISGRVFPLHSVLQTFWFKDSGNSPADLWVRCKYTFTATNVVLHAPNFSVPPSVSGVVSVNDARFINAPEPKDVIHYFETNRLRGEDEVKASPEFVGLYPPPPAPKGSPIPRFYKLALALILISIASYACWLLKGRTSVARAK